MASLIDLNELRDAAFDACPVRAYARAGLVSRRHGLDDDQTTDILRGVMIWRGDTKAAELLPSLVHRRIDELTADVGFFDVEPALAPYVAEHDEILSAKTSSAMYAAALRIMHRVVEDFGEHHPVATRALWMVAEAVLEKCGEGGDMRWHHVVGMAELLGERAMKLGDEGLARVLRRGPPSPPAAAA